jgi:uncharacterized membrane protein YkvA (DUF1232 family)
MIEPRRPGRPTNLKEYALLAPRLAKLIFRLVRDPRVPARNKATLVFVAAYLVSPLDLIPSFVAGLGQLDDIVIAALALDQLLNDVPEEVLREHWDGEQDLLELVKEVLDLSTSFVPKPLKRLFSSR